jgi:hypothetical protein
MWPNTEAIVALVGSMGFVTFAVAGMTLSCRVILPLGGRSIAADGEAQP